MVVTAAVFIFALALTGTRHQLGPFALDDLHASLLFLQGFTATIATGALVLASVIGERARVEQRLEVQEALSRAGSKPMWILATDPVFGCSKNWDSNKKASCARDGSRKAKLKIHFFTGC